MLAVDAHDLAFGTSRWSSKLVHGGLRYLANGQIGVAHESAVERGILMEHTAPHLVRPLPMLTPLTPAISSTQARMTRMGMWAGDQLRRAARTSRRTLPSPRRLGVEQTLQFAAGVRREGLRGGILGWDGQLEDDARLVIALARTAVTEGAVVRTHVRAVDVDGGGALLRDERTGVERRVTARAVINATGVWADTVVPDIRLRPSRGTHLVVRASSLGDPQCAVMAAVPGSTSRFVFALPQPDGLVYVGLTDEEVDEVPDVPEAPESDVDFLLEVINGALERPLTRDDVVGTYAGLRPLLDSDGASADLSRRHAVLTSPSGVITVVGGKLTTYRRMAEDAVDAAVAAGLSAGPSRTRRLPLVGAAPRNLLATLSGHPRLVRRFGTEAAAVLAEARDVSGLSDEGLLAGPITLAELIWGVTHEGASDVDDLLDRRVRVGLVAEDREAVEPLARRALELANR